MVEVEFKDEMIRGAKNDGEIISVIEIDAPAMRGESNVEYSEIYEKSMQNQAKSMKQNQIPVGRRDAVRKYFESINPQRRSAD